MRNYSCSEHLHCPLQFTEQTFGIYLANHDIFFMWSSVYASLVYISWDWAVCQGAGGWSQQTPPQPHGTLGGTLGHSCSSPTWEQAPSTLLLPPGSPSLRMQHCWELHSLTPPFFPQPLLRWSHGLGTHMSGHLHMLFSAHFKQKVAWCPGVARSGGETSDGGTRF